MKKPIPIVAGLAAALAFCYFAINVVNQQLFIDTFNRMYAEGIWGKDSREGDKRLGIDPGDHAGVSRLRRRLH